MPPKKRGAHQQAKPVGTAGEEEASHLPPPPSTTTIPPPPLYSIVLRVQSTHHAVANLGKTEIHTDLDVAKTRARELYIDAGNAAWREDGRKAGNWGEEQPKRSGMRR